MSNDGHGFRQFSVQRRLCVCGRLEVNNGARSQGWSFGGGPEAGRRLRGLGFCVVLKKMMI